MYTEPEIEGVEADKYGLGEDGVLGGDRLELHVRQILDVHLHAGPAGQHVRAQLKHLVLQHIWVKGIVSQEKYLTGVKSRIN